MITYNNQIPLQEFINNAPNGAEICLPEGSYYTPEPLMIEKELTFIGHGKNTYFYTNQPNAIFFSVIHEKLTIKNLLIDAQVAGSVGIQKICPQTDEMYFDLLVENVAFKGFGKGIDIAGAREPIIDKCTFEMAGTCVEMLHTSNPQISNSLFKAWGIKAAAIKMLGQMYNPYGCGLRAVHNTVIGFQTGIEVAETDYADISHNMIDYCDLPILVNTQDQMLIAHNYIGSRGAKGIEIINNGLSEYSQHIKILGNDIVTYSTGAAQRTGILAEKVHGLHIKDNTIHFWNQKGIDLKNCLAVFEADNYQLGV